MIDLVWACAEISDPDGTVQHFVDNVDLFL